MAVLIAQRVEFRIDGKVTVRDRTFMDTSSYNAREWEMGIASLELGDCHHYKRIELIGVQPIMSED